MIYFMINEFLKIFEFHVIIHVLLNFYLYLSYFWKTLGGLRQVVTVEERQRRSKLPGTGAVEGGGVKLQRIYLLRLV